MKYLKMLGLAAVAALAFTVFLGAGSASGLVWCKTKQSHCAAGWDSPSGQLFRWSLKSGKKATLKAAFSEVQCSSASVEGKVTNTGGNGKEVETDITEFSFTECKCGERVAHITTTESGSLRVNDAGTLTSLGTRFTINCTGLASCIYGTVAAGTDIGIMRSGEPAEIDGAATFTWSSGTGDSGQFVCAGFGDTGTWTGTLVMTGYTPYIWIAKT